MRAPWWLVLGQGSALVAAALALLTQPGDDHLLTFVALMALCWLIAGCLDLADLWLDRRLWGWKLLSAAAGLGAGLYVLRQPLWSTLLVPSTLLAGLGAFGIALGAIGLARAAAVRGWVFAVLGGISLVMGVLLLVAPPLLVVWAGAAWAAVGGTAAVVTAVRLRTAGGPPEAEGARELAG